MEHAQGDNTNPMLDNRSRGQNINQNGSYNAQGYNPQPNQPYYQG